MHNNQRDGYHRTDDQPGPGRATSRTRSAADRPAPATAEEGGYVHYPEQVEGTKIRARSEKFRDYFSQATLFWNSMSDAEKEHIVRAFRFELGKVLDPGVRKAAVDLINNVDDDLAAAVAEGVGVEPPSPKGASSGTRRDPTLSQETTVKDTVKTRKVAILALDGYDHAGAAKVREVLLAAGARPEVISGALGTVRGTGGEMQVDHTLLTVSSVLYDAVYVPGGEHVTTLQQRSDAVEFVREAFRHCKPIGATGEGIELLQASDLGGVTYAEPRRGERVVADKGVVTSGTPGAAGAFAEVFTTAIAQHRHWAREEGRPEDPA